MFLLNLLNVSLGRTHAITCEMLPQLFFSFFISFFSPFQCWEDTGTGFSSLQGLLGLSIGNGEQVVAACKKMKFFKLDFVLTHDEGYEDKWGSSVDLKTLLQSKMSFNILFDPVWSILLRLNVENVFYITCVWLLGFVAVRSEKLENWLSHENWTFMLQSSHLQL